MSYYESFEKIRTALQKSKIKESEGHFAIQVTICDPESSGIFYIEDFGDRVVAEPYNYYDNDAEVIGTSDNLQKLFEKKLDFSKAQTEGIITAFGDTETLKNFFDRLSKTPARKTATKKATAKKTAPKTTVKKTLKSKTEDGKVSGDTNKNTKPKDTETVKEVVEKEVKPKSK